jgi:hypothetical protein
MKERLKAIAEWTLPPAVRGVILRSARRAGTQLMSRPERDILARNSSLQGAYRGRRCFVIGNGPSLASENIDTLGGEITVVMNGFNQHHAIELWQPVVQAIGEPASEYTRPNGIGLDGLKALLNGYTETKHVFPIAVKEILDRNELLPRERVFFVRQDGRKASEFDRIDLTKSVPAVHDTSILALSVAIAMGCSPIILLGMDYDWLARGEFRAHFYDDAAAPLLAEDLREVPYVEEMRTAIPRWEAHAALRRVAQRNGQTILNATRQTFLDIYSRTTLDDVLARS